MDNKLTIKIDIILFGTAPKTYSSIIVLDIMFFGGGSSGHHTFGWDACVPRPRHRHPVVPIPLFAEGPSSARPGFTSPLPTCDFTSAFTAVVPGFHEEAKSIREKVTNVLELRGML